MSNIGHANTDTTLIGMGGSTYATESFTGAVPFDRVRDLFDFTVGFTPIYTAHEGVLAAVPDRHAVVRDDGTTLNVVSKKYAIHQFGDVLIDNLLTLTDSSDTDLDIVGAGLLSKGAVGWVQVQAPSLKVAGDDLAPTLTLASSHNGTLATSYRVGMFRFACSNQIGALRTSKGNVYKLRHTMHSVVKFSDARAALGLMWDAADDFTRDVNRLIDTTVTDTQFAEIVRRVNPRPTGQDVTPSAVTRWENRTDAVRRMWTEDERVAPWRGTAWGAVQAFSTYRQWEQPFRSVGTNGARTRLGRNMENFLSGKLDGTDVRVIDTIGQVVGV